MYYRLAAKNLLSQKTRTVLTTLGITIGIASLVLLLSLSEGLKKNIFNKITQQSPLTQITVQAKGGNGGFLKMLPGTSSSSTNKLTTETLDAVKKIPHVTSAYPEMNYSNISSLQINLLGQVFQTDALAFGLPYPYISGDLNETAQQSWQNPAEPYPVILPHKIIDLYNFTVAPSSNMPNLSEKSLLGMELTLLPDYSTFFSQNAAPSQNIKLKIVGFSDKVSLVGVTMPIEVLRKLNLAHDPQYQENYLRLLIEVDEAQNVDTVKKTIEAMNYDTSSPLAEVKTIEENFRIVTFGLSLISLIILLVSGFTIANTFLASVSERRREIGMFRALGATRSDIQNMFLAEASVIGFTGGLSGIIIGFFGGMILNIYALNALPDFTQKPDTIFVTDPATLLFILLFAIFLSTLFAFIPAAKAAHVSPLEALTQ